MSQVFNRRFVFSDKMTVLGLQEIGAPFLEPFPPRSKRSNVTKQRNQEENQENSRVTSINYHRLPEPSRDYPVSVILI